MTRNSTHVAKNSGKYILYSQMAGETEKGGAIPPRIQERFLISFYPMKK